ncbi:MAG: sodium-dependent transporter [Hyphomicrobiaceae bacterium]
MQEQWQSRIGFVLAAIGAAVGLGNIWRFAYVAGENGGGVFLLTYVCFVILIGWPLVIAEITIGRRSGGDTVTAIEAAGGSPRWRVGGWLLVVGALLILSYYSVIAGWAVRYFVGALTGGLWEATAHGYGEYFERFIANGIEPIIWQALILAVSGFVVAGGIQQGIERLNLLLMPLLALIVAGLAIFSLTLPGSGAGVRFLLAPDWSAFGRPSLYLAALGQAFFSLGLGMAVFITYGGYLGASTRIPGAAATVVAGDTLFALVAGLAIFPAVFALGGDPAAGPRLAFVTFPQILLQLPGGWLVGPIFFFLLSAAALTSMISLLEVGVTYAVNRLGIPRIRASWGLTGVVLLLGVPSALSYGLLDGITLLGLPVLDAIDQGISNFVLPIGGLLVAALVGWRMARAHALADADLAGSRLGPAWLWAVRVLAPAMIVVILVRSLGIF